MNVSRLPQTAHGLPAYTAPARGLSLMISCTLGTLPTVLEMCPTLPPGVLVKEEVSARPQTDFRPGKNDEIVICAV